MGVYTTINDGSAYFHTQLYTGNGASTHAITNDANAGNFKPDWLWIKQRSLDTRSHSQWDSSRGNSLRIQSNSTGAEETQTGDQKTFDTDGFTVGGGAITNENSQTFVAWQWKANGGTKATNTDGATNGYNTTVQANQTAGFSIVQWNAAFDQGNGRYNLGHGLGKIADFIIIKNRAATGDWYVHHKKLMIMIILD